MKFKWKLVQESTQGTFMPNKNEIHKVISEKNTLYCEKYTRPWRPCFLLHQNFFNESERGPPKEHSCQIRMKSMKSF